MVSKDVLWPGDALPLCLLPNVLAAALLLAHTLQFFVWSADYARHLPAASCGNDTSFYSTLYYGDVFAERIGTQTSHQMASACCHIGH